MTIGAPLDTPPVSVPLNSLVTSPILPTLLRLALPRSRWVRFFCCGISSGGRSRLRLKVSAFRFQRGMFIDILKVGAIACLSPLQSALTLLIFTKVLAGFDTETLAGYGMGSRLEFLLTPIVFAIGVASVPMVGMAVGAGSHGPPLPWPA